MPSPPRVGPEWVRIGALALLALTIAGYQASSAAFYLGFRTVQGYAMNHLPAEELAHYALFAFFGTVAVALGFVALRGLPLVSRLEAGVDRLCGRPWVPAWIAAAIVLVASLGLSSLVLGHAVTTDDEHTYRFIARTLRTGALAAPSPGGDLEFFREQFVVLDERVRFGKYPIGHPLMLAAGQAIGLEALVVPLLAAAVVFPLYRLGTHLAGRRVAGLACLLYAASPQVWFTGATYLSQPTSALALAAGLALLVDKDAASPRLPQLLAAGACFGFGVLVRPLPGVLFAAAAAAEVLWTSGPAWRTRLARTAAFALPAAAVSAIVPLTNLLQTGSALVSGYQAFHAPGQGVGAVMGGGFAFATMSIASAAVRLNFWLFGWPLSIAALLFAGRLPRRWLFWGVLASEIAYRVAAPKAGVGGAGPIYVFEAVPVLCLLSAIGLARLARGEVAPTLRLRPHLAPALLALSAVSLALFVPPKLADLGRMAAGQLEVERQVARRAKLPAVVFHEGVTPPWTGLSWAYFPRDNGPRLDDDVIFLRFQRRSGLESNLDVWKRRFPERSAWYFGWGREKGPFLVDLTDFVRLEQARTEPGGPRVGLPAP